MMSASDSEGSDSTVEYPALKNYLPVGEEEKMLRQSTPCDWREQYVRVFKEKVSLQRRVSSLDNQLRVMTERYFNQRQQTKHLLSRNRSLAKQMENRMVEIKASNENYAKAACALRDVSDRYCDVKMENGQLTLELNNSNVLQRRFFDMIDPKSHFIKDDSLKIINWNMRGFFPTVSNDLQCNLHDCEEGLERLHFAGHQEYWASRLGEMVNNSVAPRTIFPSDLTAGMDMTVVRNQHKFYLDYQVHKEFGEPKITITYPTLVPKKIRVTRETYTKWIMEKYETVLGYMLLMHSPGNFELGRDLTLYGITKNGGDKATFYVTPKGGTVSCLMLYSLDVTWFDKYDCNLDYCRFVLKPERKT